MLERQVGIDLSAHEIHLNAAPFLYGIHIHVHLPRIVGSSRVQLTLSFRKMSSLNIVLVDTEELLDQCIKDLTSEQVSKLAIDLEGVELCRFGRIVTLQILADCSQIIWIIDVTTLGKFAFDHTDSAGRNLRSVLENEETKKLFYDVRNDSDALFHLQNITLANVYDLQILEVAMLRSSNRAVQYVSGLSAVIGRYIATEQWQKIKNAGATLCFPSMGGSYDRMEGRPLDPRIIAYAAQDVALLFQLEEILEAKIGNFGHDWKGRVARASAARVREAYGTYSGHGWHRAIAPFI